MPRMPNNTDGHVLNATLLIYNADTWTDAGRAEFAKWLREKAKLIKREGKNFTPRVKMQRWSVAESPAPIPAPTPQAKKRNPNRLDLKATPNAVKDGRVKTQLKSTPRSKFEVAPYRAGQLLKAKRANG